MNPPISGILGDYEGDNISLKNRDYCELTAHYFAWKNVWSDYYGFCHYRRFFCFDKSVKRPYLALKKLSQKQKTRLLGNEEANRKLILEQDIIVPYAEHMGVSVREYYSAAKNQSAEDLKLFLEIMKKQRPDFESFAEKYLSQERHYFCNMFIMHREFFFEYCEILFPILDELDRNKTHRDDRTDGYLGEVFTGIYIEYARTKRAKIMELARLDVNCGVRKRIGCFFAPPESRRRFFFKKVLKKAGRS